MSTKPVTLSLERCLYHILEVNGEYNVRMSPNRGGTHGANHRNCQSYPGETNHCAIETVKLRRDPRHTTPQRIVFTIRQTLPTNFPHKQTTGITTSRTQGVLLVVITAVSYS